jgi:RHS repeat-associated protein
MAKLNPFRFSTKYDDDESDLVYYGYRYYKPSTGTWPNRDPLGDTSFFTSYSQNKDEESVDQLSLSALGPVYCFVANNPISGIDHFGLACVNLDIDNGSLQNSDTISWALHAGTHFLPYSSPPVTLLFAHPCAKCQKLTSARIGNFVGTHDVWSPNHPWPGNVSINGDNVVVAISTSTWFRYSAVLWYLEMIDVVVTCCDK